MKRSTHSSLTKAASSSRSSNGESFSFGSPKFFSDKEELIEKNIVFTINTIDLEEGRGYEGDDRWALAISMEGRPDEVLTLGKNDRRDTQFHAARDHISKHGPIGNVRLTKSGNAYYLEDAARSGS